jgi:hypothetical protein
MISRWFSVAPVSSSVSEKRTASALHPAASDPNNISAVPRASAADRRL